MKTWDEVKEDKTRFTLLIFAADLIILSVLLFQTANSHGLLYEHYLKPDVYIENYTLNAQYIGDIEAYGNEYTDILIMDVTDMQGVDHTLFFAKDTALLSSVAAGDTIAVTWVQQKIGRPYIHGVSKAVDNSNLSITYPFLN